MSRKWIFSFSSGPGQQKPNLAIEEQGPLHNYSHVRDIYVDRNDPEHMQNPDSTHGVGKTWRIHCKLFWDQRNPGQKNQCLLMYSFQAQQLQNHEELMGRTDSVIQEQEDRSMEMSGQHLASISNSATDILAVSPETFQAVGFKLLGNVSIVAFFAHGNREIVSLHFFPFFPKFSSPSSLLVQNLIRCFWDNLKLSKDQDSHFDVVTPSSSLCAQNQVRTMATKHDATARDFMSSFCLGYGHLSNRKCPL